MRKGDRLTLAIERPAAGGRMIARHEGAVVLVAGAIPGESVEAEVEKVQHGTAWARTRRVLDASPDRLEDAAEPECGGCTFAHVRYERQLTLKAAIVEDAFRRLGRLTLDRPVEVVPSPVEGYRLRARLHVRRGRIGFFREGTHDLCDAGPTRQLRADTIEALTHLGDSLRGLGGDPVSGIELSENLEATERACHLELAEGMRLSRLETMTAIAGLTGVSSAPHNEPRAITVWGSPLVSDTIPVAGANLTLVRHARAFFQGNRHLLVPLVEHVLAGMARGPVLDLYSGVGLFGAAASVAGHGPVVAVEGDGFAAADLTRNAAQCAGNLEVRAEAVEAFLARPSARHRPVTVILDPPRSGLSKDALAGTIALGAPRLIYVSCDVATLARDTRQFVAAGYQMTSIRAFDMFPNTAHVETVIVLSR